MKIIKTVQFENSVSRNDSVNQEFYQELNEAKKQLNSFNGFHILHNDKSYNSFENFIMSRAENDFSTELVQTVYKTGFLDNMISFETIKESNIHDKADLHKIDWEALQEKYPGVEQSKAIALMYPEMSEDVLHLKINFKASMNDMFHKENGKFSERIFKKKISEYLDNLNFQKDTIPKRLSVSMFNNGAYHSFWNSIYDDENTNNAIISLIAAIPNIACQDYIIKSLKNEPKFMGEVSELLLSGNASKNLEKVAVRNSLLNNNIKKDISTDEYYNIYETINRGDKTLEEIDIIIGNISNLDKITREIQNSYYPCLIFAFNNPDYAQKMMIKYPEIINEKLYLCLEKGSQTFKQSFFENHSAIIEVLPKEAIKENLTSLIKCACNTNTLTMFSESINKIGLSIENGNDYSEIFYNQDRYKIAQKSDRKKTFSEAVELGYNPGRILKMVQLAINHRQEGKSILSAYKKEGLIDTKNITFLTAISASTNLTSIFETYKTPINKDIYNKLNFDGTPFWWSTKDSEIIKNILKDENKNNYIINSSSKTIDIWDKLSLHFHRNDTNNGFGTANITNMDGLKLFDLALEVGESRNEKIKIKSSGQNILHDVLNHNTYHSFRTHKIFETLAIFPSKFDFDFKQAIKSADKKGLYPIDKFLDIRFAGENRNRDDLAFAIVKQKITANNVLVELIFNTLAKTTPEFVYEFLNAPNNSGLSTLEKFKELSVVANKAEFWAPVEQLYNSILLGQIVDNHAKDNPDNSNNQGNWEQQEVQKFKL